MNNNHNIHYLEQIGGRVVTSKVFYADTPQNRKLKRVGKLYKYKHTYGPPGRKPRVWYTLVKKKSPKKCPPNKEMSPKGNCVLKKCPSGKKLTLKGKCINKPKKSKRITVYQAKELFDAKARAERRRSGKNKKNSPKRKTSPKRRSSRTRHTR